MSRPTCAKDRSSAAGKVITRNSDNTSPNGDPWERIDATLIRARWVALAAAFACFLLSTSGFWGKS